MPNQYTFSDDDDHYLPNQATATANTTYELKDSKAIKPSLKDRLTLRGKKSRRTSSFGSNKSTSSRSSNGTNNNDDDGTGSLTYSATSSVASESSFHNNIVRLLQQEGRDSKEIAALLNTQKAHHQSNYDEKSCAADSLAFSARSNASDSLAYSEEAESYMRMLAADGESTAHISQVSVSLLQGTALLSNAQSESSSQNAYSGLTTSYLNNGGGQRLDITDEGKVMMMFSPAEHTDSMKRRKERKRRERLEKLKLTKSNNKADPVTASPDTNSNAVDTAAFCTRAEQKSPEVSDVSSVAPTVVTPNKSKISFDSTTNSTTTTVVRGNSSSSRSVSGLPINDSTTTRNRNQSMSIENADEYKYDTSNDSALSTPTNLGSHRGSSRLMMQEPVRGQQHQPQQQKRSFLTYNDSESTASSKDGYKQYMRPFCPIEEDDDMFYTKWCSFCFIDDKTGTAAKRSFSF